MAENELIAVKNGDKSAFEELLVKYEPLIFSEAAKIIAKNPDLRGEEEEMRQEGRMALYDAAMGYKENEAVTFGLYAKICVHNRLISYLRKLISRQKRAEKADAVKVAQSTSGAAEELMFAYESSAMLRKLVSEALTDYERRVLLLYMEKKSYAEIAAQLGKDEKSVDNALCRAKGKIRKLFL